MNFYRLQDIEDDHDRQQAKQTYQHNINQSMTAVDKAELLHFIVRGYVDQPQQFTAQA